MIVYTIFTMNQGVGGHYFSLKEIASAIGGEYIVVVVGYTELFVDIPNKIFIDLTKLGFIRAIKEMMKIVPEGSIIHSFDDHSYSFARIVSLIKRVPICLTKCGGKRQRYFPKCETVSVFSIEDYEYLSEIAEICLFIPNRINSQKNNYRVAKLPESQVFQAEVKIICIARISEKYRNKIFSAVGLLKAIQARGFNANLVVIGSIESCEVFRELNDVVISNNKVAILSEREFTANASIFLHLFDISVATGRNAMESLREGLVTYCPVDGQDRPVLIDQSSFDDLFAKNFSGRGGVNATIGNPEYSLEVLNEKSYEREALITYYKRQYEKYFDINNGVSLYKRLYSLAKVQSLLGLGDIIINHIYRLYIKRQKLK